MDLITLKNTIEQLPVKDFISSKHNINQHRIFGFITTNIRSIETLAGYVIKLLPEYISRKNNYEEWEKWFKDINIQKINKHKFKRLELAKILFRNVQNSQEINDIGEKLYRIYQNTDKNILNFVLHLYLLTGRYFDIDNQPLIEINKFLSNITDNLLLQSFKELLSNKVDKLTLAMLFYNPSIPKALEIHYELIQNKIFSDSLEFLKTLSKKENSILYKRARIAGGIKNFKKELAVVLNYYLFKQACKKNFENAHYETIISDYIDNVFEYHLNDYFHINNNENIKNIFLDNKNRIMFKDIFEFTLGIKFNNQFVRRKERKNIKQTAFEKYGYKCFFDYFATENTEHKAHELNYFKTKKDLTYLEGHHMIQMENSKFFEKDIDIVENIIPVCPNCHRKIHNANKNTIMKMLKIYYTNSNKNELIRKGIFVDIETLANFYGIEGK